MNADSPDYRTRHREAVLLLPWLVSGQLEEGDRGTVEQHLPECEACRADLAGELALSGAVINHPIAADLGWAVLRERVAPKPRARAPLPRRRWSRPAAWVVAAQAAAIVALVFVSPMMRPAAPYRVLGATPDRVKGNVIVMFRPDARSDAVSGALASLGARVVDGPTEGGAFVLSVPSSERARVLIGLRAQPVITLAEPIERR